MNQEFVQAVCTKWESNILDEQVATAVWDMSATNASHVTEYFDNCKKLCNYLFHPALPARIQECIMGTLANICLQPSELFWQGIAWSQMKQYFEHAIAQSAKDPMYLSVIMECLRLFHGALFALPSAIELLESEDASILELVLFVLSCTKNEAMIEKSLVVLQIMIERSKSCLQVVANEQKLLVSIFKQCKQQEPLTSWVDFLQTLTESTQQVDPEVLIELVDALLEIVQDSFEYDASFFLECFQFLFHLMIKNKPIVVPFLAYNMKQEHWHTWLNVVVQESDDNNLAPLLAICSNVLYHCILHQLPSIHWWNQQQVQALVQFLTSKQEVMQAQQCLQYMKEKF